MPVYLLSTVLAPVFKTGVLELEEVEITPELLETVSVNLCGHPLTDRALREVCPTLPAQQKAFWQGDGVGIAVRPKGGVRGAGAAGDTPVTLADLEAVKFWWHPD